MPATLKNAPCSRVFRATERFARPVWACAGLGQAEASEVSADANCDGVGVHKPSPKFLKAETTSLAPSVPKGLL